MHPHIPVRELWWLAAGSVGYGARYIRARWRAAHIPSLPAEDPTDELLKLQSLYGYNAHSLVSIAPGARMWSLPGMEGAIIYGEFRRVWLAAGDPLAPFDAQLELARRFLKAAHEENRRAAFVPATVRFAHEATKSLGMSAVKVGAAPYFNLKTWSPRGDRAKHMRSGVNQARRSQITVETVEKLEDSLRRETAALCLRWLEGRRAATTFGWLLALDPFLHAERKKFFAARDASNRMVGLIGASPIPARDGWYLEDVLRLPDAPQGTADLLVFEALKRLAEMGASLATLGTSPLAEEGEDVVPKGDRPVVERALRVTAARLGAFYNFEGLRRFKAKFVPDWWESEYALAPRGLFVSPHVTRALVRAVVPGGLTQLLTRKVARTLHPKRKPTEDCEHK